MKVGLASDHAGVALKQDLSQQLGKLGNETLDFGPRDETSVDYPDYASLLCRSLLRGEIARGILICGTGLGMAMAANRFPGIRAAPCATAELARLTRLHNNANVLCLGARFLKPETAWPVVEQFLRTDFEGGRHQARVEKLG